jgi:hypothetical protein
MDDDMSGVSLSAPPNQGFTRPFPTDMIAIISKNLEEPLDAMDCVAGVIKKENISALVGLCLMPEWSPFAQESLLRNVQIKSQKSAEAFLSFISERSDLSLVRQLSIIGTWRAAVEIMAKLPAVKDLFLDGAVMLPSFRDVGCELFYTFAHSSYIDGGNL